MSEKFENVTNVSSCGCARSRNHEEYLVVDNDGYTKCIVIGGKEAKTILRWSKEKGIHLSTLNPD